MDKYIKDGKVAVLYSPGYGGGYYTWNEMYGTKIIFDPEIVQAVLDEKDYHDIIKRKYPKIYFTNNLEIEWIYEGNQFEITEYDGYEIVYDYGKSSYIIA